MIRLVRVRLEVWIPSQWFKPLWLIWRVSNKLVFHCVRMLQWILQVGFPRLGRINSSASISRVLCFSFLPSFLPSVRPSVRPSLLQVDMTLSSVHVGWLTQKESPVPAVTVRFYAREVSQEFAYVQIDSRWFETSQRYIWCLRQPNLFLASALHARHVCVRFECPDTLCPLHSHSYNPVSLLLSHPQLKYPLLQNWASRYHNIKKLLTHTSVNIYSRYHTLTDVYTTALLLTKPSSDDDSGFGHGFGAEASLPLVQSAPATPPDFVRLLSLYRIARSTLMQLSLILDLLNVFPLVWWKKSKISQ